MRTGTRTIERDARARERTRALEGEAARLGEVDPWVANQGAHYAHDRAAFGEELARAFGVVDGDLEGRLLEQARQVARVRGLA